MFHIHKIDVHVFCIGILGLSLFLILFERQESFVLIFLYVIGWGIFGVAPLATIPPGIIQFIACIILL